MHLKLTVIPTNVITKLFPHSEQANENKIFSYTHINFRMKFIAGVTVNFNGVTPKTELCPVSFKHI